MEDLKSRFFRRWAASDEWFTTGLLIASAKEEVVLPALPKISTAFAGIDWDLLSRKAYPHAFRHSFVVKRRLGGFRLLLTARKRYELVAICWPENAKLRDLHLYAWFAFLVMRPKRFFVITEEGNGFWLGLDNAEVVRYRFPVLAWIWDRLSVNEKNIFYLGYRKLVQVTCIIVGLGLMAGAVLLLLFWRLFYDTYDFRYRFLGKVIGPAPRAIRREIEVATRADTQGDEAAQRNEA